MAAGAGRVGEGRPDRGAGHEPNPAADALLADAVGTRRERGTYALVLFLPLQTELEVGRLGLRSFPAGYYVYAGSAQGGLAARVSRHLHGGKRLRWHVDYLRARAVVVGVYAGAGPQRRECAVARALAALPAARMPVPGFGSSDCRCATHLVWLPSCPDIAAIAPGFRPYNPAGTRAEAGPATSG